MSTEPRVCLDLLGAQEAWTADRGVGRFIAEQATAVLDRAPDAVHSLLLHADGEFGLSLMALSGRAPVAYADGEPPHGRTPGPPDVLHVMAPFAQQALHRVWPAWARHAGVATVVTLYDLIPLRFPERYLADPAQAHAYRARLDLVRRADGVLAISERTAQDAVELLACAPERITVVGAGASTRFADEWPNRKAAQAAVSARWPALACPFLLYVGGDEPRKNIEGLFRAVAALPEGSARQVRLAVTCALRPAYEQHLLSALDSAGVPRERVVLTGRVSDRELAALYRCCTLFVFPSFYEGSGLPLLEAMSCGAPAIASRSATGPEILGSTDGTFDPADPADIAARIAEALDSPERLAAYGRRSVERAERFRWSAVAERSLTAYADAATRRRPRRGRLRRGRARLALVTPAPPERSGIATYSAKLAIALAEQVDVELVVDPARGPHAALEHPAASVIDVPGYRMRRELGRYDRVLFCMGNSEFHGHVFDEFLDRPDAVMLHDMRVTQFFRYYGFFRLRDPQWFGRRLARFYGDAIPPDVQARGDVTREEADRLGIFMSGELQALAPRMIVFTRFAAEVARLDRRGRPARAALDVIPMAGPPVHPRTAAERPNGRRIVSLGYTDEVKGVSLLTRALAELLRNHPDATLTFVGTVSSEDAARWSAAARELGIERSLRFTGFVSDERYWEELAQADLAVQLRTNGEGSAVVMDCLAAGVPTVVTDMGWSAELPAGSVVPVPLGVAPRALADVLGDVLADAERRTALSRAGLDYARQTGFPEVARRFVDVLGL